MEYLKFINEILTFRGLEYSIDSFDLADDNQLNIYLVNEGYNFWVSLIANETTINDVLQTSAQMMLETLAMQKPNSFYRFQPAWNAGFYPDNQIVSDLLNELYIALQTAITPILIPGTNLYQVKSQVAQVVEQFNAYPYYGNFSVQLATAPDPPNYIYSIIVRDESLYLLDNTQQVEIQGYFNLTTKLLVAPAGTFLPFSPGSYSGTFGAYLINEERKVSEALEVVYQNGSAFFPITYSYDASTKVATSGLARGSDWKLWNDIEPNRLPLPSQPLINRRLFSLPMLTADDTYILSIFERIIQASLADTDYTNSVQYAIFTYTVPDGWTRTITHPSFTTYDRVQVTYSDDSGRRKFMLVGRLDGAWLWQRFVSDESGAAYNFLTAYLETTQLPYEVNQAGRWLYNDNSYDLEFVEFNSGCYESDEFYAMPAKPGDQFQFNIERNSANMVGIDSALIGLFTEDGQFIQKIGTSILPDTCNNTQLNATLTIPNNNGCFRLGNYNLGSNGGQTTCELVFTYLLDGGVNAYVDQINENYELQYYTFALYDGTNFSQEYSIQVPPMSEGGFSIEDIVDWSNTIPGMVCTYNSEADTLEWTWTVIVECDIEFTMQNFIADSEGNVLDGLFSTEFQSCECVPFDPNIYHLYSLSNIINIDASDCFSTIIEFWADSDSVAEGFEYYDNWKQRVRLGVNGGGEKPIIEENVYRQSNGVHRRPQNKQDLSLDLHTDFLDLPTQLALVDATRHPYFVWNGKNIFVNGDLEVATIQDFSSQSSFETLAQVKFSALLQGFQPRNSSCLNC